MPHTKHKLNKQCDVDWQT